MPQQVYNKDLQFWRPVTKRTYDNPLWVSVTQIDGKARVSIPATSQAVQRQNGFAAYLRTPLSFSPTVTGNIPPISQVTRLEQGYPDSEGNVSPRIATIYNASSLIASLSPISVGIGSSVLLVEGSFITESPATVPVIENPTDISSERPHVGIFGQAIVGRINSSNEQNLWLVGGSGSTLGGTASFNPKSTIDTVTITQNVDTSLTVVSINRSIGLGNLFPTCCVIESEVGIDRLLYTGGMPSWTTLSVSSTLLDINGNVYAAPDCPESMTKSSAISIPTSGVVLVTGGVNNTLDDSKNSVRVYNSYDNSWNTTGGTLRTNRRDHQTVILNGGIGGSPLTQKWALVVGGKQGVFSNTGQLGPDLSPVGIPINKCEVIDVTATSVGEIPATSFVSTGSMADARYAFGMTKLGDNRVLVCGGIGCNPGYPVANPTSNEFNFELNRCEIFDPTIGIWSPIQSMLDPHSYCVCCYVPEANKVYVYGGYSSVFVEYLDLDTMTWHKSIYTMPTPVVAGSPFGTKFGFMGVIGGGYYNTVTGTFIANDRMPS